MAVVQPTVRLWLALVGAGGGALLLFALRMIGSALAARALGGH